MKKVLLSLLGLVFLCSFTAKSLLINTAQNIDICHYDAGTDSWQMITINETEWAVHAAHGDVRLDDQDGDGYVPNNECGYGQQGDCNDNDSTINPGATDECYNDIDEDCDGIADEGCSACVAGEVEIDFNGPLFVAPADEPGSYTWQGAIDACNAKDTDGCDWFLPSQDELNELYFARNDIGGFDVQSGAYWSSTEFDSSSAYLQYFGSSSPSNQVTANKLEDFPSCRCVRR